MHCPNCGHKQICPCPTCLDLQERTQKDIGVKPWKWIHGLGIRCGGCGFEQGSDWWEALSISISSWHRKAIMMPMKKDMTKETVAFFDKLEKGTL